MVKRKIRNPSPAALLVLNGRKKGGRKMAKRRKASAPVARRRHNPRRHTRRRRNPSLTNVSIHGNPLIGSVVGTLGGAATRMVSTAFGSIGGTAPWASIARNIAATFVVGYAAERIPYVKKYAGWAYLGGWAITGAQLVDLGRTYLRGVLPTGGTGQAQAGVSGLRDIVALPFAGSDSLYGTTGLRDIATFPAGPNY